jgi:hypothetical protein
MQWPLFAAITFRAVSLLPMATASAFAQPVVVELFTSEGCSSCPPADRFLAELAQGRHDVLALSFHVTYWNSLGWRDPYSFQAATDRQNDYAARFGSNSVFTPQMVVDGTQSLVGSNRSDALATIAAARGRQTRTKVTLEREGENLLIDVGLGDGTARVLLVGFDHEHQTSVGRGENSGRTLVEANIVRSIATVGHWTGKPMTALVSSPYGEDAAVLLQSADGTIVAAAAVAHR